ncbi:MAG: DUF420 domain-containing protein [Magnetospirillum sp. WYHS-4]
MADSYGGAMIEITQFPHLLAGLNVASATLLAYGYARIRKGAKDAHRQAMLAAVGVSVAFLVAYLYYHANSGLAKFGGQGAIRPVYFTLLASHVLLAAVAALAVPWTLFLALTGRFERHRRWARFTLPLWLYVAVTGVVVYVMAVHIFPQAHV